MGCRIHYIVSLGKICDIGNTHNSLMPPTRYMSSSIKLTIYPKDGTMLKQI